MEIINIDRNIITKLIKYVYKKTIPRNSVLTIMILKLYGENIDINSMRTERYKIYGFKMENGNKIYSCNDDFIIEDITFIDNYSPLLSFYENKKYESAGDDNDMDDLFYKQENIISFYLRQNIFEDDFLSSEDKNLYDYIKGIIGDKKYYKKLIYILNKYEYIEPEYIVNVINKFPNIVFVVKTL